jgi:hypothetical protein
MIKLGTSITLMAKVPGLSTANWHKCTETEEGTVKYLKTENWTVDNSWLHKTVVERDMNCG